MRFVISPERALAEGVSPQSLAAIAKWHEDRAAIIDAALGTKKKRAFGGPVTAGDQLRHEQVAVKLRAVAASITHQSKMPLAA